MTTGGSPLRVVVIGAGMAGIAAVVKLHAAGVDDVAVYEKAERTGGTWRENTYPGVACDVPAHMYSYSFAPNPEWSHLFAPGAEIDAYLARVAGEHGVLERVTFGAEVSDLAWRDGRWHITIADGRTDEADVVIAATGVLHHPSVPDLPGLGTFAGAAFHSARWDHGVALAGARLGLVGTGSSAVQIAGAVVGEVGELELFQRTPQWILPAANSPIPEEDRRRFREDPAAMRAHREELEAGFTAGFADVVVDASSAEVRAIEELCRAHLESSVADPDLRERLTPDYRAACKRLVVSADFYDAVQRPNARLVCDPIERVEPRGIRTADGSLHELDVLVLATGFRVDRFLRPIRVRGRDGLDLEEVWAERPSAYLSVAVPGFPNLFMLNGPNGPVGNFSLIQVAELQLDYVIQLMAPLAGGDAAEVSPTPAAAARFEEERVAAAAKTIWVTGCRSWYLDDRGVPAAWPWTMERFGEVMAAPDLDDWEVLRSGDPLAVR